MNAEVLKLKGLAGEQQDMIQTIHSSAQRGAKLIRQILTFARGASAELSEIQLRHLIKETKKLIGGTFPPSIQIHTNVPSDLWTILGDSTQMDQVLMNLCVNARDAMPNGGRLTLAARNVQLSEKDPAFFMDAKPGPFVELSIADTGSGIPKELQDRIFDPFFTTKELGKGTGLGLATVASIVKAHHGSITVESEVGKGTCFRIHLPAVTEPTAPAERQETVVSTRGHGECILVVDDEASICDSVKTSLEHYGYRVVTAKDGIEALTVFTHNGDRVRLVITDLMMPNLSGPAFIRVLNTIEPQLPIMAISGLQQSDYENMVAECAVKGFIRKPFSLNELTDQVAEVLTHK